MIFAHCVGKGKKFDFLRKLYQLPGLVYEGIDSFAVPIYRRLKTWKCILYCFWYQSFRFLFRFSIPLLGAAAEGEKANSNGGCLAQKTGLFAQIASSHCAAENLQLRRKKLSLTCFLRLFIIVFKNPPKKSRFFFTASMLLLWRSAVQEVDLLFLRNF